MQISDPTLSNLNQNLLFVKIQRIHQNLRTYHLGFWQSLISRGDEIPVATAAAASKSLQSCPSLCDPRDGSPPGSPVPGILQARTLEWVAISFSNAWKWKVKVKSLSCVRLFAPPWTAVYQAPLSRQEYWSGMPSPSPEIPVELFQS